MELPKSISPEKSYAENLNPNLSLPKPSNSSPATDSKSSIKSQKSASKNPVPVIAMRLRKFVQVSKKNKTKSKSKTDAVTVSCKCKDRENNTGKCPCVAYENLRASQEEFFKNRGHGEEEEEDYVVVEEAESPRIIEGGTNGEEELEGIISTSGVVKRRRERVMEEARNSVPENGAGRVMHLVKAFEKLLSIPNSKKNDDNDKDMNKKAMKWALPGLQNSQQRSGSETDEVVSDSGAATNSSSLFCASDLVLTSQNLGLDQSVSVSSSWDSSRARFEFRLVIFTCYIDHSYYLLAWL